MATDLRVPMDPLFAAFGVPATVTRPAPDDAPIVTAGIWVELSELDVPRGMAFQRRESPHVMALTRADVPTMPRGTLVVAPETLGGTERTWRVDGIERADADHHRVFLVLDPELES